MVGANIPENIPSVEQTDEEISAHARMLGVLDQVRHVWAVLTGRRVVGSERDLLDQAKRTLIAASVLNMAAKLGDVSLMTSAIETTTIELAELTLAIDAETVSIDVN